MENFIPVGEMAVTAARIRFSSPTALATTQAMANSPDVRVAKRSDRSPIFLAVALLGLAVVAAYANSFRVPLILDDWVTLRENLALRHGGWAALWPSEQTGVGGRPVANFAFVLNHAISGNSLVGYHVGNLLIHLLGGAALFGLVRRTLVRDNFSLRIRSDAEWLALIAAALWLLHPLQTESVTYLSQRTEALMGLCFLATMYFFARAMDDPRWRWKILATICCWAGMATKEGMVTLPVIAFLYDYAFGARSLMAAWKARRGMYAGFGASWLLLAALMRGLHGRGVGFGFSTSWWKYALTECSAVTRYLELAVWPARLVFDYGTDLAFSRVGQLGTLGALIILVAATGVALLRAPGVGFLGAWFFITLSPTSSIVPIPLQPISENRTYVPLAAVVVAIVLIGYRSGRKALWGLGTAAVAFGVLTFARNHDYRSEISIWADTVAKQPASSRAHSNYAQALQERGRYAEAKKEYELALRLKPAYAEAWANLASVLGLMGQNELAAEDARRALSLDPNLGNAHYNLGIALIHLGRLPEAIDALQTVLREQPANVAAHSWLAQALLLSNHPADALLHAQEALRLNPDAVEARYQEACAFAKLGRAPEAVVAFAAVVNAQPGNFDAWYSLGTTLINGGRPADAINVLRRAVQLNPRSAPAHANLGVALWQAGPLEDAAKEFEVALQIDPTFLAARQNLDRLNAARAQAAGK